MVAGSNPAVPTSTIHKDGQKEKSLPAHFYFGLTKRGLYTLDAFREGLKEVVFSAAVLCVRNMIGELYSNDRIGSCAVLLSHRHMQNDGCKQCKKESKHND